ncbi:MAG: ABC transporter ATP-binding protein [Geminicoccaceae bacterium]
MRKVLEVRNLQVRFPTRHGALIAVDDVSLHVGEGEVLGLVGESGAGKSLTGSAVIGLLDPPGHISAGHIILDGRRIDNLAHEEMRRIRGGIIGTIFQDPLTSLDPLQTIGGQLVETIVTHTPLGNRQACAHAIDLLAAVGVPEPKLRARQFPHEFSGGMRQRAVIALALCAGPRLVIADEPTTALDVSTQAQVIALLKDLCREQGTAMMLITHDMGVIAEMADRVAVMYAGRIAETGPVRQMVHHARHPYTRGLMDSIPRIGQVLDRLPQIDGTMPRPGDIPSGCAFHPRCRNVIDRCRQERPDTVKHEQGEVACWRITTTGVARA